MSSANLDRQEEGLDRYRKGGFHPVRLGELYSFKYKVLRKLGYGQYSTVWLVRNQEDRGLAAMKVIRADAYGDGADIYERDIMEHLKTSNAEHEGYRYISTLQDHFTLDGPNGSHVCLVFKLIGESLQTFKKRFPGGLIPFELAIHIANQLTDALAYAHSCGVIHTDIKADNIMFQIPDGSLSDLTEFVDDIESKIVPLEATAAQEDYAIIPTQDLREEYLTPNSTGAFNVLTLDIALSDWGVSSWTTNHLCETIQPILLRAPEVMIGAPWGPAVDFWNLGCLVTEMIYGQCMFSGKTEAREYSPAWHLEEMTKLVGPFPKSLLDEGDPELVKDLFNEEGNMRDPKITSFVGLDVRFSGMQDGDREYFTAPVKTCLELDPVRRMRSEEKLVEREVVRVSID
ncbi:Serine/threonine-protein kinase [Lachnellula occidentalis]|uniref:non-specific serine/threonine protein kinase n=1 Tax=Lachnellula occidentalis TaxID=215460 RepID=A0A8H8RK88_9HELO|nr:Serine/threonine-protein kinase [Lachnellula occidentalis]